MFAHWIRLALLFGVFSSSPFCFAIPITEKPALPVYDAISRK
jgi:hypothetical protein